MLLSWPNLTHKNVLCTPSRRHVEFVMSCWACGIWRLQRIKLVAVAVDYQLKNVLDFFSFAALVAITRMTIETKSTDRPSRTWQLYAGWSASNHNRLWRSIRGSRWPTPPRVSLHASLPSHICSDSFHWRMFDTLSISISIVADFSLDLLVNNCKTSVFFKQ